MYNKPLTIAATTILLCSPVIILSSCEKKDAGAGQPQALVPDVQVTKLVTEDVPIKAIWIGNLRGTEDAEIRSQVTGYLLSKDYKDGAYVKKGQTLFQIDPRPFQATLEQAQGRLEQYEATLKKYQLDVERYTPLVKSGSVSRKQLDDALQQVPSLRPRRRWTRRRSISSSRQSPPPFPAWPAWRLPPSATCSLPPAPRL